MYSILQPRLLAALVVCACLAACSPADERVVPAINTPGVTDSEVLLGSSLALRGHASFLGTQTLRGAMSYLNHVNAQGGIHGRTIKVIALDDSYDPPMCLANTQKLIIEDRVFALFCYVGTPTTVRILPLIEDVHIPLLGMFTGANALRDPFDRYLINIRASYYQETGAAVSHLVNDLGLNKDCCFLPVRRLRFRRSDRNRTRFEKIWFGSGRRGVLCQGHS